MLRPLLTCTSVSLAMLLGAPIVASAAPLKITSSVITLERGKLSRAAVSVRGGKSPYTVTTVAPLDDLPGGLSLASDGTISGTPETEGVSRSVTFRVVDANGRRAKKTVKVETVGNPYDLSFTQDSGTSACDLDSVNGCVTLNFTATHSGNGVAIDHIDISIPTQARAGVALYQRISDLALDHGESHAFSLSVPSSWSYFTVTLADSFDSGTTSKSYTFKPDDSRSYAVAIVSVD